MQILRPDIYYTLTLIGKYSSYLPTEVEMCPVENNNFATIKITTYQHGLFWEGLCNKFGYVSKDKNVTPVELNAGFKVTMLDSSPNKQKDKKNRKNV